MGAVTYTLTVSYKLVASPSQIRKWASFGQPHPNEQALFQDILKIIRGEPEAFEYDGRNRRRELRWTFRTSLRARSAERKIQRLRRAYPRDNIKTEVTVRRPTTDSVNSAISQLLSGSSAEDVVEDLSRTSAFYAAAMMHFNKDKKADAEKKAATLIGITPADDTLHAATVNHGIPKTTPTYQHVVKSGAYSPEKRVMPHPTLPAPPKL